MQTTATFARPDGTVLLRDVVIDLREWVRGSIGGWGGTFAVGHEDGIDSGGSYRILLADGRRGDILVEGFNGGSAGVTITFGGSGLLTKV